MPERTISLIGAYLIVDLYEDPGKTRKLDRNSVARGRDLGEPLYIELDIADSIIREPDQMTRSKLVRLRADGRNLFDRFEEVCSGCHEVSHVVLESVVLDPENPHELSVGGFRKATVDDLPILAEQHEMVFYTKSYRGLDFPSSRFDSMENNLDAAGIYNALGELRSQLRRLHEEGRLKMSSDSWNKEWQDADQAAQSALEALDVAVSATTWMETLPDPREV